MASACCWTRPPASVTGLTAPRACYADSAILFPRLSAAELKRPELAASVGDAGAFVRLDVTDPASWANCVEETTATFGLPNVLVNNAGLLHMEALLDIVPARAEALWRGRDHAVEVAEADVQPQATGRELVVEGVFVGVEEFARHVTSCTDAVLSFQYSDPGVLAVTVAAFERRRV